MKKVLALVLAAMMAMCVMAPALAEGGVKLAQVLCSAHGDRGFTIVSVAVQDDVIVAATLDELQFLDASAAVGVPNSDGTFGKSYPEGQVLGSKRANNEMYSANMSKAGSTVAIADNFDAVAAFTVGKTIAELEDMLAAKSAEEMVDAVAGCTLADTAGYVTAIVEAAKVAK